MLENTGVLTLWFVIGLSCHFVLVKKSWKDAVLYILVPDIWLKGKNVPSYALYEELEVYSGIDPLYI